MSVVTSRGSELSQRSSRGAEASRSPGGNEKLQETLFDSLTSLQSLKKMIKIYISFMNPKTETKRKSIRPEMCFNYLLSLPAECPRLIAVSFLSPVSIQILIPANLRSRTVSTTGNKSSFLLLYIKFSKKSFSYNVIQLIFTSWELRIFL